MAIAIHVDTVLDIACTVSTTYWDIHVHACRFHVHACSVHAGTCTCVFGTCTCSVQSMHVVYIST